MINAHNWWKIKEGNGNCTGKFVLYLYDTTSQTSFSAINDCNWRRSESDAIQLMKWNLQSFNIWESEKILSIFLHLSSVTWHDWENCSRGQERKLTWGQNCFGFDSGQKWHRSAGEIIGLAARSQPWLFRWIQIIASQPNSHTSSPDISIFPPHLISQDF